MFLGGREKVPNTAPPHSRPLRTIPLDTDPPRSYPPSMKMLKKTVKFPEDVIRAVNHAANKKGVSFGHIIRECVGLRMKIKKPLRQGEKGWRPPSTNAST